VNHKNVLTNTLLDWRIKAMADKESKVPENVDGKYYVDTECTACETCVEIAPENFEMVEDEHAYVKKQPENEDEEEACAEAMESCPVEAIGDDG
jgi:ferredoxin